MRTSEEEKARFQELANACCRGNVSDMIRKAVNGGHAAQRITGNYLESLIAKGVEKALKALKEHSRE